MKLFEIEKGFTLIEVMIAIFIFSIGILAVAAMQGQAIKANSMALDRTEANTLGISIMEILEQLDFDALELRDTDGDGETGLDDGKPSVGDPTPLLADHSITSAMFATDGIFESLGTSYQINGIQLLDTVGNRYTVFWNIADRTDVNTGASTKVIRLFIYWYTRTTRNSLVFTNIKYNNVEL